MISDRSSTISPTCLARSSTPKVPVTGTPSRRAIRRANLSSNKTTSGCSSVARAIASASPLSRVWRKAMTRVSFFCRLFHHPARCDSSLHFHGARTSITLLDHFPPYRWRNQYRPARTIRTNPNGSSSRSCHRNSNITQRLHDLLVTGLSASRAETPSPFETGKQAAANSREARENETAK